MGKNWFDIFLADEFKESVRSILHENINNSTHLRNENFILTKLGEKRRIDWSIAVLKDIGALLRNGKHWDRYY